MTPHGHGPAGCRAPRTAPVRPAPVSDGLRPLLRSPGLWIVAAALAVATVRVGSVLHAAAVAYPRATALAVGLFALYAVPFLAIIRHFDYFEREPPALLAAAFAWGATVAVAAAVPGNAALDSLLAKLASPAAAAAWGPALAGALVEEPVKLLGVVALALLAGAQVNSVLDGFVYGAVVGLGFQVMENVVYAVNAVAEAGTGDPVGPVLTTFFLRGFVAGLWSHTLFSALAGAGVGYAVVRRDRPAAQRWAFAVLCLGGAALCHAAWNAPVLALHYGLGPAGVLAELLVKGVPALLVVTALTRAAGHREADYYGAVLARLSDARAATPAEIAALASPGSRAAARRAAHRRSGRSGADAVRRLQRAQARLAVELSRGGDPATGPGGRWYREILHNRRRMRALGLLEAAAPPARPRAARLVAAAAAAGQWLAGATVVAAVAVLAARLLR